MTKNLLLGSTALVGAIAIAAPAFADIEVTLSGQVEFGTSIADKEVLDNGRGYTFFMDSETKIQAEGAADNGINYSAKVELETDADNDGGDVNADETVLAFWGGFGRIELGRDDGASDNMIIGGEDFQAGTGGIDGDAANLNIGATTTNDSGDAAKVTYFTPRVAGFQLGASFAADTGDNETDSDDDAGDFDDFFEVGANYTRSFGGADVTIAASTAQGKAERGLEDADDDGEVDDIIQGDLADREDYSIGVGANFQGFGAGVGYTIKEDADEGDGFTIGATYGFGPANVSAGYSQANPDTNIDSKVLAFAADYKLFPGVKMKGDIAFNDTDGSDKTTAGVVTIQVDY